MSKKKKDLNSIFRTETTNILPDCPIDLDTLDTPEKLLAFQKAVEEGFKNLERIPTVDEQLEKYAQASIRNLARLRPDVAIKAPYYSISEKQNPALTFSESHMVNVLHEIEFIKLYRRDIVELLFVGDQQKETKLRQSLDNLIAHCLSLGDHIKFIALTAFEDPIAVADKKKRGEKRSRDEIQGSGDEIQDKMLAIGEIVNALTLKHPRLSQRGMESELKKTAYQGLLKKALIQVFRKHRPSLSDQQISDRAELCARGISRNTILKYHNYWKEKKAVSR